MVDLNLLSPWVRRFLMEYLIGQRNLAPNTQKSYRDTLRMLLPFVAREVGKPIDRLEVLESTADALINAQALGSVHPMNEDTIKELIQVFLQ